MKFNVLVTTYEFIMYDRSKLSKVDWKYIIIDEAQRMKDRESVLARDLDRYRCQRRLLLTGTPLQVGNSIAIDQRHLTTGNQDSINCSYYLESEIDDSYLALIKFCRMI